MKEKIYLETFEKYPWLLHFPLLTGSTDCLNEKKNISILRYWYNIDMDGYQKIQTLPKNTKKKTIQKNKNTKK